MIYIFYIALNVAYNNNIHNIYFDPKFMSWNLCQWQLVVKTPIGSNLNRLSPDAKIATLTKILDLQMDRNKST